MKDYIKVNQEVYNNLAQEYKEKMQDYIVSDKKILVPFTNYLKNKFRKTRVLELGPGSGLNLHYLEEEGFETTAIDFSPEIIKVSQEKSQKTEYLFSDFLTFDFGESKFEGIFAKAFIHLFPKEDALIVLRKIFNLLENEGAVYIATTRHKKSEEGFFEKVDYNKKMKRFRRKWEEEELMDEIKKIGFVIHKKYYSMEPNKSKKWLNLIIVKPSP